ncbi:hypothetical protein EPN44_08820 [bacterium]|nr:MAG: hypothetical protein EPN44_08820 [bacterium]
MHRDLPVRSIVRAIAGAARRWEHCDLPLRMRAQAALERRTGFSAPVVEVALDRAMARLTAAEIERTLQGDLGSLDVLDRAAPGPYGEAAYAAPAGIVVIVSSTTTIGVGLWPALLALCCKNDVVLKEPDDALGTGFFSAVVEEEPLLAGALSAASWQGGDEDIEEPLFARASTVVAFGADQTLRAIRARLPVATRFVGYGHAASIGIVLREALVDEDCAMRAADGAAVDLSLYESTGCLSLHALYVERGAPVAPERFASLLAEALAQRTVEFPVGRRDLSQSAAIRGAREMAAFRSAGGRGGVFTGADLAWTIIFDPPAGQPPAFLPRTLSIAPVKDAAEAIEYAAALRIPVETIGVTPLQAPRAAALQTLAARVGASRICALGAMQDPHLASHHGARPRVTDFVHWIDVES